MSSRRINSVSEIHADQLTFGSLQWLHGVFHPISYGAGRDKKHSCWRGVQTRLGELEEKLWYQLVESLIQKAGEQALLDALIEWESNHNYTRDSPQEVRKEALRLHTARLFDDPRWIHFVPFNRKYRPEALEAAHLVTVVSECCHTPGEVTQEQIDHAANGMVACPCCGKWSPFRCVEQAENTEENKIGMEMVPR